tara:strand:- start:156 stop:842 length:687 start_codon:yes stop_codon:yes gene_type:complete
MEYALKKPQIVRKTTYCKEIKIPSVLTPVIAELVGIHFGDGGIHIKKQKSYIATYTFNLKEEKLIEDTRLWFRETFELELGSCIQRNAIKLYNNSKILCYFLHENFGAPLGRKDALRIPPIVKNEKIFLKAFLRGLFRTDGCIFIKKDKIYRYPIVKISTKCKEFAEDIKIALLYLEFRPTINKKYWKGLVGYDVVLHGTKQYKKWVKEISNHKMIKNGDAGIRISET